MKTLTFFRTVVLLQFPMMVAAQTFEGSINDYLSSNEHVSSVGLTATIKSDAIADFLSEELDNPIADGESPELGFLLHADEAVTIEKVERMLVTPAREAYNEVKRIPKRITQRIKVGTKTVSCLITPWKWGTCLEDVYKTVTKTIIEEATVRIPAVEAVYKDVLVPYIEINQAIVPVKGKFNYTVDLHKINTTFKGNKYIIDGIFNVDIRTSIYLDLLPRSITPKGNVSSRFQIQVTETGYVQIKDDGTIAISSPTSAFKFKEVLGSGFVVDAISLGSSAMPATDYLLNLAGKEIDKQLNEAVKKLIENNSSKLNVRQYATNFLDQFQQPLPMDSSGLVYPNVTGLFVSQLSGRQLDNDNVIEVRFGITFQPFATFQSEPVILQDEDSVIRFGTEILPGDGFHVSMPAFLTYSFVSNQLKPFVDQFNKENEDKPIINKFKIDYPTAKYEGKAGIELGVTLFKRKKNKRIGESSLDAFFEVIEADTSICVKISNIKIRTSNLLIFLAKGKIKKLIIKQAEEEGCKSLGKEVLKARKRLHEKMVIKTPLGDISGNIESLSLTDILPSQEYVLMKVDMAGKLGFNEIPLP